jgi:hypothetical protein
MMKNHNKKIINCYSLFKKVAKNNEIALRITAKIRIFVP